MAASSQLLTAAQVPFNEVKSVCFSGGIGKVHNALGSKRVAQQQFSQILAPHGIDVSERCTRATDLVVVPDGVKEPSPTSLGKARPKFVMNQSEFALWADSLSAAAEANDALAIVRRLSQPQRPQQVQPQAAAAAPPLFASRNPPSRVVSQAPRTQRILSYAQARRQQQQQQQLQQLAIASPVSAVSGRSRASSVVQRNTAPSPVYEPASAPAPGSVQSLAFVERPTRLPSPVRQDIAETSGKMKILLPPNRELVSDELIPIKDAQTLLPQFLMIISNVSGPQTLIFYDVDAHVLHALYINLTPEGQGNVIVPIIPPNPPGHDIHEYKFVLLPQQPDSFTSRDPDLSLLTKNPHAFGHSFNFDDFIRRHKLSYRPTADNTIILRTGHRKSKEGRERKVGFRLAPEVGYISMTKAQQREAEALSQQEEREAEALGQQQQHQQQEAAAAYYYYY